MKAERMLARLDGLYDSYLADAEKLERSRKPTELFGLKFGPSDDPRHERFMKELAALLDNFRADGPSSEELRAVLEWIYNAPKRSPEPKSACWMLIAVQGLTRELIGGLSPEDAAALAAEFEAQYPRRERMPVQDEILKALRAAGGKDTRRFPRLWK